MRGLGVAAEPAGHVCPIRRPRRFGGFFGWRGRRRGFVRAGAGQELAGAAVVVAVEAVWVARQQVFLGIGLVGEVGAVVVERLRRRRRRVESDDPGGKEDQKDEAFDGGIVGE